MYRAKAYGRNRYVLFDETMHTQTVTRWQMEMDLRGAVNRKEFLLYYQPIIALEKGEITGFEALLRWTHPQQGLLPASKFISIVEETDLIMPVSEWVLREVCGQLIRWNQQYPDMIPLVISINLFSRQLLQTNFVRVVKQILKETGIDANNIMIDITESMIMDNTKIAARVLKQLKAMKIQLTIDDFGTGYSSLGYIRKFPADLLKIDRSFISRMNDDEESLGIVRTVITMARNMGLKVIAEGVETAEQLKQLRTLGCDYAQGFYFSQPLDSQEVEHMLKKKPTW
jgi:EAL domain-containing protein (putative c-di-GMP-specific phosphodiesterase class I)